MARTFKRSREEFESELKPKSTSFVLFGTPLPSPDLFARDDGAIVPLHLQEVRDERGRRRLHGAFTGGWSAGYFNTVGSKEGWSPASYTSSRNNRKNGATLQRPEDYMDDEDLVDHASATGIQTTQSFAGLGERERVERSVGALGLLLLPENESIGTKLLNKMGWKYGQGIGSKVRRAARLGGDVSSEETRLFAPANVPSIRFQQKLNCKGLGWNDDTSQSSELLSPEQVLDKGIEGREKPGKSDTQSRLGPSAFISTGKTTFVALLETEPEMEDPYEIGPRMVQRRIMVQGKAKVRRRPTSTIPLPIYNSVSTSNPMVIDDVHGRSKTCRDGRCPLVGYVVGSLGAGQDFNPEKYHPSTVPADWRPRNLSPRGEIATSGDLQRQNRTPPLSVAARASLLGESRLPSQSVFEFLTPAAREKLAAVTGKIDLPRAGSRSGLEPASGSQGDLSKIQNSIPSLDKDTALAALARGFDIKSLYSNDQTKQRRYRDYIEHFAQLGRPLPSRPSGMTSDDFFSELQEFYTHARDSKPMAGFMASRFKKASGGKPADALNVSNPALVPTGGTNLRVPDPRDEAARIGMYGDLTRSTTNFNPGRLLCKRFNVNWSTHTNVTGSSEPQPTEQMHGGPELLTGVDVVEGEWVPDRGNGSGSRVKVNAAAERSPDENLFRAVFGDSDDEAD